MKKFPIILPKGDFGLEINYSLVVCAVRFGAGSFSEQRDDLMEYEILLAMCLFIWLNVKRRKRKAH